MRLGKALGALAMIMLLGGCGGGGASDNGIEKLSADNALAKVKADAAAVTSVHVKGEIDQSGKSLGLDVRLGKAMGTGTLTISGGQLEIRLLNGTAYVRGDQAALIASGAPASQASLAADKWLKGSATTGSLSSFSSFLDIKTLFNALLTPQGSLKTGSSTTVNGTKAFSLIDTSSSGGTLYIALTGKALPLRIMKTGSGGGQVDFTDYDAKVTVTAPAGAIDISQLGQ
jgi:hypothetical protein